MEFKKLGELGIIFTGTKTNYIKSHNSSNGVEISLLNWGNLKNILHSIPTYNIKNYNIDMQYYYKIEQNSVKYGDIVFAALPSQINRNIDFITKYDLDNFIYDDNMCVFRNKSEYDSKYIYILLKNHIFPKYIKMNNYNHKHRITVKSLLDIQIPIINDKNHILDIIDEYEQIEKLEKDIFFKKNILNNKILQLLE